MKTCTKCKQSKEVKEFYPDKKRKDSLTAWCKECHKKSTKRYRKEFPDKAKLRIRDWTLRKQYGISLEDYALMLEEQNGVCSICRKECYKENLSVDHCHETGVVRGLLCQRCNSAIGMMDDSYEIVNRAAKYLKYHEKGGSGC